MKVDVDLVDSSSCPCRDRDGRLIVFSHSAAAGTGLRGAGATDRGRGWRAAAYRPTFGSWAGRRRSGARTHYRDDRRDSRRPARRRFASKAAAMPGGHRQIGGLRFEMPMKLFMMPPHRSRTNPARGAVARWGEHPGAEADLAAIGRFDPPPGARRALLGPSCRGRRPTPGLASAAAMKSPPARPCTAALGLPTARGRRRQHFDGRRAASLGAEKLDGLGEADSPCDDEASAEADDDAFSPTGCADMNMPHGVRSRGSARR